MKRILHIVILVLGLAALILAASASDSGADLLYTVPAGLCGCGLIIFAVHGFCRETPEEIKARRRREYREGWQRAEARGNQQHMRGRLGHD